MLGRIRKHITVTESTNLDARELIRRGAFEGTLVTADFQTRGRGRRERRWISSHSESVLASYILYPKRPLDEWCGLPFLAGLAVVQALDEAAGLTASLKWPNDVLVDGKKICGILVESGTGSTGWAIAGIGINVNQAVFDGDYRTPPTSVYLETGVLTNLDTVIEALSKALDAYYSLWTDMGNEPIIEAWKQHSAILGKDVLIEAGASTKTATAEDIGADGCLIVRLPDGTLQRVYAGDVTLSMEKQ